MKEFYISRRNPPLVRLFELNRVRTYPNRVFCTPNKISMLEIMNTETYDQLNSKLLNIAHRLCQVIALHKEALPRLNAIDEELATGLADNQGNEIEDEELKDFLETRYVDLQNEQAINAVNGILESTFTEIIEFWHLNFNPATKKVSIRVDEILENPLEELIIHAKSEFIERELNQLTFYEKYNFILTKFKLELKSESIEFKKILLLRDLRNLIAHNGSRVNVTFIGRYGKSYGKVGERLTISQQELNELFAAVIHIQVLLESIMSFKFDNQNIRETWLYARPVNFVFDFAFIVRHYINFKTVLGHKESLLTAVKYFNNVKSVVSDSKMLCRLHLTSVLTELYMCVLYDLEMQIVVNLDDRWLQEILEELQNPELRDLIKYSLQGMEDGSFDLDTYIEHINNANNSRTQYISSESVWEDYLSSLHSRIGYMN